MRRASLGLIVLLALSAPNYAGAQASTSKTAKTKADSPAAFAFEPLDTWKAAVLAGDRSALMALYTTMPPAHAKTPQGEMTNPAEEPDFWSALKSNGLDRLNVQVLETKTVQPGVLALTLRMEAGMKQGGAEKSMIVGASQVWVQKLGDWKIIATQRSDFAEKQVRRLPEPVKPNTQLYPPAEEAKAEIDGALAVAKKDHKRVILIFGGNWCYDCHVLDTTFRSKEFAPIVNANYHVVHVNVGNYDVNLDLVAKYQIPLNKGVPSLAVLDADGNLLVSQKQGEFESTVRIGPEDVLAFLKKWAPPRAG